MAAERIDLLAVTAMAELIEICIEAEQYLAHNSDCNRIANGVDGDCPCGVTLVAERFASSLRMSGWTPRTNVGDWAIDTSTGRPILVYKNCSVIEAEDAHYVMSLIKQAVVRMGDEP